MSAFDLILFLGVIPMSKERPCTIPTNSELKRWLNQKAVRVNNKFPHAKEEIIFPVIDLVFFPKAKSKVTVI